MRTYDELIKLKTFKERFEYLKIPGEVGQATFGFERYLNQVFYRSPEWKSLRQQIIIRDQGCDLGILGMEIGDKIYIHHMNPITKADIANRSDYLMNPDYLICTSHATHNAIHYGNNIIETDPIIRQPNDQCPWRK